MGRFRNPPHGIAAAQSDSYPKNAIQAHVCRVQSDFISHLLNIFGVVFDLCGCIASVVYIFPDRAMFTSLGASRLPGTIQTITSPTRARFLPLNHHPDSDTAPLWSGSCFLS